MEEFQLGPNGGIVYCMEYLLNHYDWLIEKIEENKCQYIIFDCPRQVLKYTNSVADAASDSCS